MQREAGRSRRYTRRVLFLGGAQIALFSGLAGRLYQLQVVDGGAYATLADENRIDHRLLVPERGRLLDRHGRALAKNRATYRVRIVREQARDFESVLGRLAELLDLAEGEVERVRADARRRRAFVPLTVREELTWDQVALLALHTPDLPGVVLDGGRRRLYPYGAAMAHVVGYVGPVSERELDGEPLLQLPEMRIGKDGVERVYDRALRGSAGSLEVEVNALGRDVRELARREGDPGDDLRLSIDAELQRFAYERIAGERSASAVVLDVQTGGVLAAAAVPSFDPAGFENGIPFARWRELTGDPLAPLVNKAVAGQYPPGSTFKMVVALAALAAGEITPQTTFYCGGALQLGSHRFHCWRKEGHGRIALHDGLAQSCDVFFYETARRVGVDAIAAMGNRLGLGAPLGLDLPSERPGLMPTRAWKQAKLGDRWHPGETLVAGIGQGYVLATPVQLAVMAARIGTGRAVTPWLVTPTASPAPALDLDPAQLDKVRAGMDAVVNGPRGTARAAALRLPGVTMAGKTGTSQVRRITAAQRASGAHKRKDKPWEERHHALFVAFAPYEQPRVACAVVVEHGESGSKAAAPIARDLNENALRRFGFAPA